MHRDERLPEGIRHGVRGEPTGRDLPTDLELAEAGERRRLDHERPAHHDEPSIWSRFAHALTGKRSKPGRSGRTAG